MHKAVQAVVAALGLAGLTGCPSTKAYLVDRGRDATDVVTVSAANPNEGKLRVGTYDSRVIAMAYCFLPACEAAEGKTVAACNTELAKATGDKKQVADVRLLATQVPGASAG